MKLHKLCYSFCTYDFDSQLDVCEFYVKVLRLQLAGSLISSFYFEFSPKNVDRF